MKKNEFLKAIRSKYKMSQKKFAEYLEVSKSLIEKVEMGKVPAVPENKYVKAVCALEGLDNEIFRYDEITEDILEKHELTKFSQVFRKFLFFYYGDFWSEEFLKKFLFTYSDFLGSVTFYLLENEPELINTKNFEKALFSYYLKRFSKKIDIKKILLDITTLHINNKIETELKIFIEILIILTINNFSNKIDFKPSSFNDLKIYLNFLKNEENKKKLEKYELFYFEYVANHFEYIYEILELQENIGYILTIENIKVFKEFLEAKKIKFNPNNQENVKENNKIPKWLSLGDFLKKYDDNKIEANKTNEKNNIDPKDQKILKLLHYAPPAFKDKIIEKLEKFRDEVEKF